MRYFCFVIILCMTRPVIGDQATLGSNGINSLVTGLDGSDGSSVLGQVENGRPGKPLYDTDSMKYASNTVPSGVFFRTDGGQDAMNSANIDDHATAVAGIMIGQTMSVTGGTAVNYADYRGVAPGAFLYSTAIGGNADQVDIAASLNRMALISGGNATAINISFVFELGGLEEPNGSSYLTQFVDWSAHQHDVLYVAAWGNENQDFPRTPADNFNGITVGASMQPTGENVWRKFGDVNSTNGLGLGDTLHIDLLAPGQNIQLLRTGDIALTDRGTSYAAPHVAGAVALLQQYAFEHQEDPGMLPNARRHQVMKAVLMNSADKISGVHGAFRTVIDSNDMDWTQSEAFGSNDIPLDDQMGAGLLNVQRAVQQIAPGEHDPGMVPLIGWDYGAGPDAGQTVEYVLDQPLAAGEYIAITLAYDRPMFCTCDTSYETGALFVAEAFPDLNISLETLGGTVVASSTGSDLSVEHIFTNAFSAGQYKIVVSHGPDFAESPNYALAWWNGSPPGVPGDYSGNGSVGPEDYDVWRSGFGNSVAAGTGADGNGNGVIDAADYVVWRKNLSAGSGSLAAVPEPTAIGLVCVGLLLGVAKFTKRRGETR